MPLGKLKIYRIRGLSYVSHLTMLACAPLCNRIAPIHLPAKAGIQNQLIFQDSGSR